jgi:hypothetical protein
MNTYPDKYLALFLKDTCILCDNQPKKLGFCHVHCNKECINNIRFNFDIYVDMSPHNDFMQVMNNVYLIYESIKEQLCITKNKLDNSLHNITKMISDKQQIYGNSLCSKFKNELSYKLTRFDYNIILNYINKLAHLFDDTDNHNDDIDVTFITTLMLKYKLLQIDAYYILQFNTNKKVRSRTDGNDKFMTYLLDHKISNNIIYISREHILKINNHNLRADFYVIIKTNDNSLYEIIIEIDDYSHYVNKKENDYDVYKDIYAFRHGISLYRSNIIKKESDYEHVITFIEQIIDSNLPQYYFPKKYIARKKGGLTVVI